MTDDSEDPDAHGAHEPPERETFHHDPIGRASVAAGMTVDDLADAYGDAGIGVADLLELDDREPFGEVGPETIGQRGRATDPYTVEELRAQLANELDTGDGRVRSLDFGPAEIEEVAVVTGSGADFLPEAREAGVDALVTGEAKGKLYHEAREVGVNVVLGGHYATETFGVRALPDLVAEWGLETTFVDHPTGL